MDVQVYKHRLLDLEASLSNRLARGAARGRGQISDTAEDEADASVADESKSENFTEVELDATLLGEIRDALQRVENGTYGRCAVDGGLMDPKRLDAVPWARYCIKHQKLLEAASRPRPTL